MPRGPLVADSGFRPQPDGFGFENYTSEKPYSAGIGVHEMRALFGDGVCGSQPASDNCALTPPALQWETNENNSMGGGHCYGFSVTALRLFSKQLDISTLSPPTTPPSTFSLLVQDPTTSAINWPLAHTIGYDFAFQELDSVAAATVKGTPTQILEKLKTVLPDTATKEQYGLSIFKPGFKGGHEITPYAVEDQGDGRYGVLVYDNNYPGETHVLTIDTGADTWSYQAAPNPGQTPDLYQGDASTKTLSLDPTTPGLGVQRCPFCTPDASAAAARDGSAAGARRIGEVEVQLTGNQAHHAHLLIQDSGHGAIGYRRGTPVDRLRGAHVIHPTVDLPARRGTPEPRYLLDPRRSYEITLDNSYTKVRDTEGIQITGPGFAATASSLSLRPGEKVSLALSAGGRQITLKANRSIAAPVLSLGAQEKGPDHSLALRRRNGLRKGQTLSVRMNTGADKLTILGSPAHYDMVMRYVSAKGAATWARQNVNVGSVERVKDQATLDYAGYSPDSATTDQIKLEGDTAQSQRLSSEVPTDASSTTVIDEFSDGQSYTPLPPDPNADPADGGGDQPLDPGAPPPGG